MGILIRVAIAWVPGFSTFSVGLSLIFRFIVLLTKDLCNPIDLKLYQLNTTATNKQFISCMHELTLILMFFSALF